jgi:hypothetical protein
MSSSDVMTRLKRQAYDMMLSHGCEIIGPVRKGENSVANLSTYSGEPLSGAKLEREREK